MNNVTPKPLPDVKLPRLNQVGKPLRRVDASSPARASSLHEEGRESSRFDRILVFGELSKDGAAC